jgi:hypothetical protein
LLRLNKAAMHVPIVSVRGSSLGSLLLHTLL